MLLCSLYYFYYFLQGIASFEQTRIYLDERVRFGGEHKSAIYNMIFPFEVVNNSCISLTRLRRTLYSIINKHTILRTRIAFDQKEHTTLYQTILNSIEIPFQISTLKNKNYSIE